MKKTAIKTNNLTKYYGNNIGINNLNFSVKKGELYGFVGPNGAGKSTAIRTLLGFLFPDSGSATINNLDINDKSKSIKEITSYVPSDTRLYSNIKSKDLFKINKKFHKNENYESEVERLSLLFDLDIDKKFSELSTGNKKKVSIILALTANPEILILDEPTSGLDPLIQIKLFNELKKRIEKGSTVLLSSHNLAEIEKYSDKVAFINNGEIISIIDPSKVKKQKIVTIKGGNTSVIKKSAIISKKDGKTVFRYDGKSDELINLLSKIKADDLIIEKENLQDYFINMYEKGDKNEYTKA